MIWESSHQVASSTLQINLFHFPFSVVTNYIISDSDTKYLSRVDLDSLSKTADSLSGPV